MPRNISANPQVPLTESSWASVVAMTNTFGTPALINNLAVTMYRVDETVEWAGRGITVAHEERLKKKRFRGANGADYEWPE